MTESIGSRFVPARTVPVGGRSRWFAFRGTDMLVVDRQDGDRRLDVPLEETLEVLGLEPVRTQALGTLDGAACHAAELREKCVAPPGHRFSGLRSLFGRLAPALFEIAGLAFQIQLWDRRHQYCPECRAPLAPRSDERAKRCDTCAADYFPQVTPATIVLVHDGPRVLLTRQRQFPREMYALVAGFVEPGETLETCVARELLEETGVTVDEIVYRGSQPWPFPHQIMVGFTARYRGGQIRIDPRELEDARWFHRDAMPLLPPPISIARRLIDEWLTKGAA